MAHPRVALGDEKKAARGVDQDAVRELGAHVEKRERREGVRCILLAPKHGQAKEADDGMAELVRQGKARVADHKLKDRSAPCRIDGLDPWLGFCEHPTGLPDPSGDPPEPRVKLKATKRKFLTTNIALKSLEKRALTASKGEMPRRWAVTPA
jgi:hypothetical protein